MNMIIFSSLSYSLIHSMCFHFRDISLFLHVLEARQDGARDERGRLQGEVLQRAHRPQDHPRLRTLL